MMKKFTHFIAARLIKDYRETKNPDVRASYGILEGWISVFINLVLFLVKLSAGISIKSVALIADAIHTLSDSATSVVIILGFKAARKPPDKEHPFGHGRAEPVAALIVSVLLFVAGTDLIESSVKQFMRPGAVVAPYGIIGLVFLTIVVKEALGRFSWHLGDMINSSALKADALHHRTDALSSILVVISLFCVRLGFTRFDGLIGISVSLIIYYSAYLIARDAINPLLGEAPDEEMVKVIEKVARGQKGVIGVHDVIVHKYGQTHIISLHIEVSENEPASKLHNLSEKVEAAISTQMGGKVVTHIDPISKDHPNYDPVNNAIAGIIADEPRVKTFHELRIVGPEHEHCDAIFDIVLSEDVPEKEGMDITKSLKKKLKILFPRMRVVIKVEPIYAYTSKKI